MKPNIKFLQKVAEKEVARYAGYSPRRGGYTYVRGGEKAWIRHAAAGFVTYPRGASMGRPCYAELTDAGKAELARHGVEFSDEGRGQMEQASIPARLTAGARRAIMVMTPEWQFPGKATFDATGAHCAWWRAPKAVQRELQTDGVRKGKRWAYRLTEYGSVLQEALRDSGSGSQSEDAPQSAAEAEGPQSGAAKTAHRPNTLSSPSHPESTP